MGRARYQHFGTLRPRQQVCRARLSRYYFTVTISSLFTRSVVNRHVGYGCFLRRHAACEILHIAIPSHSAMSLVTQPSKIELIHCHTQWVEC